MLGNVLLIGAKLLKATCPLKVVKGDVDVSATVLLKYKLFASACDNVSSG